MNTLPIKIAFFLVLLTSCAHKPITGKVKKEIEVKYARAFAMETACTESSKATLLHYQKDLGGNLAKTSFLYECGQEKYACKTFWWNYREHAKCTPKRVYGAK